MIDTPQGKTLVHELTLEYIRQNNLLKYTKENIPNQINEIVEISNMIYDEVEKHYFDFKML